MGGDACWGKTKRQKIGRSEKPARVRQRPLQRGGVLKVITDPLDWPVPQGQDPAPERNSERRPRSPCPVRAPAFSAVQSNVPHGKILHSISWHLGMTPGIQLDTDGWVDDASLTPGSLPPRRSFHPALCASWWLGEGPRFSPAVKYFPCPLLSVLYAVKMLLTLKNREMFRKINSYQYIHI